MYSGCVFSLGLLGLNFKVGLNVLERSKGVYRIDTRELANEMK